MIKSSIKVLFFRFIIFLFEYDLISAYDFPRLISSWTQKWLKYNVILFRFC